ncbi:MAG: septal ring lytic transglycosylase RlpA family protein [Deltaproteobacteria bacterium]|jgi:rare lipoprotein A|nr:septal ring lytic transglycosylase RlpA family protein [Deltaproteobacteria bacterium]
MSCVIDDKKPCDHKGQSPLKICIVFIILALCLTLASSGCVISGSRSKNQNSGKSYVVNGKRYYILKSADGYKEKGLASWYGEPFHGRKTASGEVYDMNEFSAAHKTLPLQTWVEVVNLSTKRKMYLRINDRGPFIDGRIIDLSQAAAIELDVYRPGIVQVLVTAVPADKAKRLAARYRPRNFKTSRLRLGDWSMPDSFDRP